VITGGEGVYPHVTQSESQTWANGSTVVMAYNDSRTAPSCYSGGSYSLNGGATWANLNARPFCSGHGNGFGDPVVVYDQAHSKWVAVFLAGGCGGQGMGVWTSTDGANWSTGSCAHSGTSDDRESGWVDNNPASPFYGRIYITWNDFAAGQNIYSIFSNDAGTTWSSPVQVQSGGFIRNVQVTTGPDGTVFLAGMNEGGGGFGSRINLLFRSTNGGASWSTVTMGGSFAGAGQSTCGYFAAMFPFYWRYMSWGDIGAGPSGVVHYVFTQHGAGADYGDIYYTRSTDNGSSWGAPIRLDTDTSTRSQWMPSLAVTPTGQVFASWYDARNTTGNGYERWGRLSSDNGATWQADMAISDVASPLPLQPDPNVQACYAGDYERSHGVAGFFHVSWTDGRVLISGNPQQDEFYDKVPESGPPPPPPPPPPTVTCDNFADGSPICQLAGSGSRTGSNSSATGEVGEPNHAGLSLPLNSVWYRFTAATTGTIKLDTCGGTNFDTTLAAYTGSAVNALTQVVANDNACGTRSRISFTALAGTTYHVALDGKGAAVGSYTLSFRVR